MRQQTTKGIILTRIKYGEADRIITVLTPDQGKVRLLAKGVRKIKSRLAGGIELFSVNDISYIVGKGDLGTLTSSRAISNFDQIVKDVDRTMYAYEILKSMNKVTEDSPEEGYFDLLQRTLAGINQADLALDLIRLWFYLHLLELSGFSPNLTSDDTGKILSPETEFTFSFDDMAFLEHPSGPFSARHIKLLRLALQASSPARLQNVQNAEDILSPLVQLTKAMTAQHTRI